MQRFDSRRPNRPVRLIASHADAAQNGALPARMTAGESEHGRDGSAEAPLSIELDVGGADHLGPFGCFLAMWSAISWGELCNGSAPASISFCRTTGSVDGRNIGVAQLADDRRRRLRRNNEALPRPSLEAASPGVAATGGTPGSSGRGVKRGNAQRLEAAGRDMRARGGIVDEHHVHVAAEQALNRGRPRRDTAPR